MLRARLAMLPFAFGLALPAPGAHADMGGWTLGQSVKARLVAGEARSGGVVQAALELLLDPGWKTYWRTPGSGGIAPTFDFSASENLRGATIRYPVPHRVDDGFSVSNVYEGTVVFPIVLEPTDPRQPLHLELALTLGVCEAVCIPVDIHAVLDFVPGDRDADAEAVVAAGIAALPGPPSVGTFAVDSIRRTGGTETYPEFEVAAAVPAPDDTAIFVEAPEGWYADVPKEARREAGRVVYTLKFDRLGVKTPIAGAELVFTIVSGGRAIEQRMGLD